MAYLAEQGSRVTLYEIEYRQDTGSSLLIDYDGEEIWIPDNQIIARGPDWIRIPAWLAKRKGLL